MRLVIADLVRRLTARPASADRETVEALAANLLAASAEQTGILVDPAAARRVAIAALALWEPLRGRRANARPIQALAVAESLGDVPFALALDRWCVVGRFAQLLSVRDRFEGARRLGCSHILEGGIAEPL